MFGGVEAPSASSLSSTSTDYKDGYSCFITFMLFSAISYPSVSPVVIEEQVLWFFLFSFGVGTPGSLVSSSFYFFSSLVWVYLLLGMGGCCC